MFVSVTTKTSRTKLLPADYSTKTLTICYGQKKVHNVFPSNEEIAITLFGLVSKTKVFLSPKGSLLS